MNVQNEGTLLCMAEHGEAGEQVRGTFRGMRLWRAVAGCDLPHSVNNRGAKITRLTESWMHSTVNMTEYAAMTEMNHQSYLLTFINTKPFQRQTYSRTVMAVSSRSLSISAGRTVLSLHLSLSGCKCSGRLIGVTTEEDFYAMEKNW